MSAIAGEFIEEQSRRRVTLGPHTFLNAGGAGEVHAHPHDPDACIKIYHDEEQAQRHGAKVRAMIARTPRNVMIGSVVQLAWPSEVILRDGAFAGFVMPRLPMHDTWRFDSLDHPKARRSEGMPESLRLRLMLARNLASVLDGLHEAGHFVIDLQPKNVFAYQWTPAAPSPRSGFVALIDCDGFSIAGEPGQGQRYHADFLMEDYASPRSLDHERNSNVKRLIGYERQQDLWAYAVIAFRLLNNGLPPWDSIPKPHVKSPPAGKFDRIFEMSDIYAFGARRNPDYDASPTSRHPWFSPALLGLFERTFKGSHDEPTFQEWAQTLQRLLGDAHRCSVDEQHWKLGERCGECGIAEARSAAAQAAAPVTVTPPPVIAPPPAPPPPPLVVTPPLPGPQTLSIPTPRAKTPWWRSTGLFAFAAALGVYVTVLALDKPGFDRAPAPIESSPSPTARDPARTPGRYVLDYQREISSFPLFFGDVYNPDRYWDDRAVREELYLRFTAIEQAGGRIIACYYPVGDGTSKVERYWVGSTPTLADRTTLERIQLDHPLLTIRAAVLHCPAYWDGGSGFDWEAAKAAGRRTRELSAAPVSPTEPAPPAAASAEQTAAELLAGTWTGTYVCPRQGLGGIRVTLEHISGTRFRGTTEFYSLPGRSNIARGSYHTTANFDPATNVISIRPGAWIERPSGWRSLRASLTPSADGQTLRGELSSCTSMEVRRD